MVERKSNFLLTRRTFLRSGLCTAAWAFGRTTLVSGPATGFRAAVIGHTGRGNYGHELDTVFNNVSNLTVVAVADPDAVGREKAVQRSRALRQYADYREMLEREKPHLVSVAPRWTDQHHQIAMAALHAGAHVLLEKPITQTLAEADDIIATANRTGLRVTVAHQMRLAPVVLTIKKRVEQGNLGKLLAIHAHGKQDSRVGGEDLIVLGVHLFDLMRIFAGDPVWCCARIMQKDHEVTLADVHPASEGIGPVVGDDIFAEFAFLSGVNGTFTSRSGLRDAAGPWGLELIGTKGRIRLLADIWPRGFVMRAGEWTESGKQDEWQPITVETPASFPLKTVAEANRRVVDDWLSAINNDREPACSGYAAMKALEMAMGVFAAGLAKSRIDFPLRNRRHPLTA